MDGVLLQRGTVGWLRWCEWQGSWVRKHRSKHIATPAPCLLTQLLNNIYSLAQRSLPLFCFKAPCYTPAVISLLKKCIILLIICYFLKKIMSWLYLLLPTDSFSSWGYFPWASRCRCCLCRCFRRFWDCIFGSGKSLRTSWTQFTFDIYIFIVFAPIELKILGIFPAVESPSFCFQLHFRRYVKTLQAARLAVTVYFAACHN